MTTTPETMVAIAAYVHTTTARPSFIPRFWQKMPEAEKTTEAQIPSGAKGGAPSCDARSMPVRADAAEVEDAYVAFDLARVAGLLEAPLAEVFAACVDEGFGLPHGVETQLRREQYEALRSRFGFAAYAPDPLDKVYEDFGFKPLDETAEPLDPDARKMPEYVQDADRPTYQDGA